MPKPSKIRLVRDKKRAALAEVASYEAAIANLRVLIHDYEIAERVLMSLDNSDDDEQSDEAQEVEGCELRSEAPPKKPDGIPTMPEMIIEALRFEALVGPDGVEPMTIVNFIQRKYWPLATSKDVAPTAWRMWKDGRLAKNGSLYSLLEEPKQSNAA